MTLVRARWSWISCALLVACGGQSAMPGDDSSSASSDGSDGKHWVPIPLSPEPQGPVDDDPSFQPVSIKVPYPSSVDAGTTSSSSGWSSSSSSSSGASGGAPPPWNEPSWGPPMVNDIDSPEIAPSCADRAAARGSYAFTPPAPDVGDSASVSITRDLTEHRWVDGIRRTSFKLFFRTAKTYVDPAHGATRREAVAWLGVYLDTSVSRPDAFAVGKGEAVEIGWGAGPTTFTCSIDGDASYWVDGEAFPYANAVVTLSRRDAAGVAGTIDIENGKQKLSFDAPYGESFPGEDGICCLR